MDEELREIDDILKQCQKGTIESIITTFETVLDRIKQDASYSQYDVGVTDGFMLALTQLKAFKVE